MPLTEQETAAVVNLLPSNSWLKKYVAHSYLQTVAPLAYHLAFGISALGVSCPADYGTRYAGILRPNNFVLAVGRSGLDNKSTALNIALDLIKKASPTSVGSYPGSQEGLTESLASDPTQVIPFSEFGKFLAAAQRGYFEPIKTLIADLWDCLDAKTEILTERGWKRMGEVSIGDAVYALDRDTGVLQLTPALDVGTRPVRGGERMVTFESTRMNFRTTEGHHFYVKWRDAQNKFAPSEQWQKLDARDLVERKAPFYLPLTGKSADTFPGLRLSDDEIRFLAWFHAEGELINDTTIAWDISRGDRLGRLRNLLTRLNLPFRELRRHVWVCTLTEKMQQRLTSVLDKNSFDLHQMTVAQFILFWNTLLSIGGEQNNPGRTGLLWVKDSHMVDLYMHLAVVRGFAVQATPRENKDGSTLYRMSVRANDLLLSSPQDARTPPFRFDEPAENEHVWCVSNRYGTLVTRRCGRVVILGNCSPQTRRKAAQKGTPVIIDVPNPRLNLSAACSLPYLERHTLSEDWTGGFMGRWLVMYGRSERIDPHAEGDPSRIPDLVQGLSDRFSHPGGNWCRGFTPEARLRWEEWYYDVMKRQLPSNIVGISARAPTIARKISLALGWDYGPWQGSHEWDMGLDILEPAIAITELHIKSLIHLADAIADHPDARLRRNIISVLQENSNVATLGLILDDLKLTKRPVVDMLESLVESGRIRKIRTSDGDLTYELQ